MAAGASAVAMICRGTAARREELAPDLDPRELAFEAHDERLDAVRRFAGDFDAGDLANQRRECTDFRAHTLGIALNRIIESPLNVEHFR